MKGIREVNSILYLKSGETVQRAYKNTREAVAHASSHRRTGGHYTTVKGKSVI